MRRPLSALAVAFLFTLAACGGAASPAPSTAPDGEPSAAGDPCAPSTAAGAVTASIIDFEFDPATVSAKVGDVISWTNEGAASHTATVDSQAACTTPLLAPGASSGITFNSAGSYAFHCSVHPTTMKGTIEITE